MPSRSNTLIVFRKEDVDFPDILNDPTVVEIAEKLNRKPSQILLRFLIQHGISVIPKSVNPQRIKENSQVTYHHLEIYVLCC